MSHLNGSAVLSDHHSLSTIVMTHDDDDDETPRRQAAAPYYTRPDSNAHVGNGTALNSNHNHSSFYSSHNNTASTSSVLSPERRSELLDRSRRLRHERAQEKMIHEDLRTRCSAAEMEVDRLRHAYADHDALVADRVRLSRTIDRLQDQLAHAHLTAATKIRQYSEHVDAVARLEDEFGRAKVVAFVAASAAVVADVVGRSSQAAETMSEQRVAVLKNQIAQYVLDERLWAEERQRHIDFQARQEDEISELRNAVYDLREQMSVTNSRLLMTPHESPVMPADATSPRGRSDDTTMVLDEEEHDDVAGAGHGRALRGALDAEANSAVVDLGGPSGSPPRVPMPGVRGKPKFNFVTVRVLGNVWRWIQWTTGRLPSTSASRSGVTTSSVGDGDREDWVEVSPGQEGERASTPTGLVASPSVETPTLLVPPTEGDAETTYAAVSIDPFPAAPTTNAAEGSDDTTIIASMAAQRPETDTITETSPEMVATTASAPPAPAPAPQQLTGAMPFPSMPKI
eukprot:PhM_4_TR7065/c0_g1_i1/m.35632